MDSRKPNLAQAIDKLTETIARLRESYSLDNFSPITIIGIDETEKINWGNNNDLNEAISPIKRQFITQKLVEKTIDLEEQIETKSLSNLGSNISVETRTPLKPKRKVMIDEKQELNPESSDDSIDQKTLEHPETKKAKEYDLVEVQSEVETPLQVVLIKPKQGEPGDITPEDQEHAELKKMRSLRAITLLRKAEINSPFIQPLHYIGKKGKISPKARCDLLTFFQLYAEGKLENQKDIVFDIKEITAQLISGLRTLHAKGLFHADIKPENILVTIRPDGHIHLEYADLDTIAKVDDKEILLPIGTRGFYAPIGTSRFFAPEIVQHYKVDPDKRQLHVSNYNIADKKALDCFALGKTLEEIHDKLDPSNKEHVVQLTKPNDLTELKVLKDLSVALSEAELPNLNTLKTSSKRRITIEGAANSEFFGGNPSERTKYFDELARKFARPNNIFYHSFFQADPYPKAGDAFILLSENIKKIYLRAADINDALKVFQATLDKNDCGPILDSIKNNIEHLLTLTKDCKKEDSQLIQELELVSQIEEVLSIINPSQSVEITTTDESKSHSFGDASRATEKKTDETKHPKPPKNYEVQNTRTIQKRDEILTKMHGLRDKGKGQFKWQPNEIDLQALVNIQKEAVAVNLNSSEEIERCLNVIQKNSKEIKNQNVHDLVDDLYDILYQAPAMKDRNLPIEIDKIIVKLDEINQDSKESKTLTSQLKLLKDSFNKNKDQHGLNKLYQLSCYILSVLTNPGPKTRAFNNIVQMTNELPIKKSFKDQIVNAFRKLASIFSESLARGTVNRLHNEEKSDPSVTAQRKLFSLFTHTKNRQSLIKKQPQNAKKSAHSK